MEKYKLDKCSKCGSEIHIYASKKHSMLCTRCSQHTNQPYTRLYHRLENQCKHKHIEFKLSYEDFISFTKFKKCSYCGGKITWIKYGKKAIRYNLDRKDNTVGYLKDNCTPCCWACNDLKGNRLTYEEMEILSGGLNLIRKLRERKQGESNGRKDTM